MNVQDIINKLNNVEDKSKPVWIWVDGMRYEVDMVDLSMDEIVEFNAKTE